MLLTADEAAAALGISKSLLYYADQGHENQAREADERALRSGPFPA